MDRKRFFELSVVTLAIGAISMLTGCGRTENVPKPGNQEKLWKMTAVEEKVNEPIDLAYAKGTPALYRDASLGKQDPSFKPKTGGG
jgi:hypothetical protein